MEPDNASINFFYRMKPDSIRFSYFYGGRHVSLDFTPSAPGEAKSTHLLMIENIPCDDPSRVLYDVMIEDKNDERDLYWFRVSEFRDQSRLMAFAPNGALAVDLQKIRIVKQRLEKPLSVN